jgi:hypothetical protein
MTASTASTASSPVRLPGVILTIWLALAVVAGATGFLVRLPFPGAQLIILGLVALALTAGRWVEAVPLRWLVGFNAIRFIGIAFLVLAARGELNPVFAARAGWGDIAVAIAAVALVLAGTPRLLTHVWNALGFLDLVVAVGTATVVTIQATTPGVERILTFPLSLVPTFLVPLLFANHVFIFRRLLRDGR